MNVPTEEWFLEADGVRTRVLSTESDGPALLLLHGLHGSADHWRWLTPMLSPPFTCHAPDMRGHGRTERPPRGYGVTDYARHILAVLDALELERVSVIGNSLGGAVAMALAVLEPDRVDRLVLVCPAAVGKIHPPGALQFVLGALEVLLGIRTTALASYSKRKQFSDPGGVDRGFFVAKEADAIARRRDPAYRRASLAQSAALARPTGIPLERIRQPTLLVWGTEDDALPWEMAIGAIRRFPDARVELIPQCGHLPHVECPTRLADLIVKHLSAARDAEADPPRERVR